MAIERKKGVVASVVYRDEYSGANGTLYNFDVVMEDGSRGQYASKSKDQTKVVKGVELEYDYDTTNTKYPKIKPVQQAGKGFGGSYAPKNEKAENARTALSLAVHMVVAGKEPEKDGVKMKVSDLANNFFTFLETKSNA